MCNLLTHKWDYAAPEYRRCVKCGQLQESGFIFWRNWKRTIEEWKNAVLWANQYHQRQQEKEAKQ